MASITVVYEDNHLIAVNKPAGILVQRDATSDVSMSDKVKRYIKQKYDKPGKVFLGTIHRIDRPVSGLTLYAKTSKGLSRMNELFRNKEVQKSYIGLSHKLPQDPTNKLTHYILKDSKKNKVHVYDKLRSNAKKAITEYELISRINNVFCYHIKPITGRPHQIRAQMARVGCPLLGDLKYGASLPLEDKSIGLHAFGMSFMHPIKKEMIKINAAPPRQVPWNTFEFDDLLF